MKAVLVKKYSVKGRMYGPGEVEVGEDVYAALTRQGAFNHPMAEYPAFIKAGYKSLDEVRAMDDSVLLKLEGVGPATLRKLRGTETEEDAPKFIGEDKPNAAEKPNQAAPKGTAKGA
jgi:hypothetical protein